MINLEHHTTARTGAMRTGTRTRSVEHRHMSQDRLITLGYLAVLGGGATLGRRRSLLVGAVATVAYAVTVLATSQQAPSPM
jgi:hypothetical protein